MFFDPAPVAASDTLHRAAESIADTARAAASHGATEHGEKFEFSHLFEHMQDSHEVELPFFRLELPHLPPFHLGGLTIDLSPTKHVFFLLVAAMIVSVFSISSARKYRRTPVPTGFTNAFEALILFIRDEVAIPNLGKSGVRYVPYLLTTFFFILIMNLLGLVPYGVTATSNIAVTAGLASIAFIMIQVSAVRAQGFLHYLAHLTGGVPWYLWVIMIPVEILGLFTKPFALCIRLFANMTGGHLVILSLIGLIFMFQSYAVSPVTILFVLGINMLEIFVAFLQAYIFIMLTSLFMGLGMQAESHVEEHPH